MKLPLKIKIPEKSILGFRVLSSKQSTISSYLLLFFSRLVNPLFGNNLIQIRSGALFNIVLNISIVILILNLFFKRKQIQKTHFILLNLFLFIYFPISIYIIVKYLEVLLFFSY